MALLRKRAALSALTAAVTLVAAGAAAAATVSPSVSPFATPGCLALGATQLPFGSLNYLNSEVEPQVAVDPTNPNHLIGVWQQDRWIDGGANGLVAAYSTTGGATWTLSPQPFSACYHASGFPGPYLDFQRASDPWVSIGPGAPGNPAGSTAYSVGLPFNQTPSPADPAARHNGVGGAVSYDGGATWTHVQMIIDDPCIAGTFASPGYVCNNDKALVLDDKESVTADPTRPGVAYAVWDRLVAPPASFPGFFHERAYFGQTFISKTTDYGAHWSTAQQMFGVSSQNQTIGNQIVVDPRTGTLYDFYNLIQNASNSHGNRGNNVAFSKSTDGGATWSNPQVIAALESVGSSDAANVDPSANTPPSFVRGGDDIPEVAINRTTGQLYAVWQDARFNGFLNDEVVISTSTDGGGTWSPPAPVNVHTGQSAFDPSVYVNAAGVVGVTYAQWTSAPIAGNEPTTFFLRKSTTPGTATTPPTFGAPAAVSAPFNLLAASWAGGYFLGDYQGLVATPAGFVPFFVATNCADGGPATQPSCRALTSVLPPADLTPTNRNSADVYATPGS
jgi:hypothetical protein